MSTSDEQFLALKQIITSLENGEELLALCGPAGSGKSTLIGKLKSEREDIVVSAMTNKAADVLRNKGIPDTVTAYKASLTTVYKEPGKELLKYLRMENHSSSAEEKILLKYFDGEQLGSARVLAKGIEGFQAAIQLLGINDFFGEYFLEWGPKEKQKGVLIIDEASMLDASLLNKIRQTFSQILLVGDEFQLPPIDGEGVFLNIVNRIALKNIHRQAKTSQSLSIAKQLRNKQFVHMEPVFPVDLLLSKKGIPILVHSNSTRKSLIKKIRTALGYKLPSPMPGEFLVCRETRDIQNTEFVKNSIWKVVSTDGKFRCVLEDHAERKTKGEISIRLEDEQIGKGLSCRYAYALTCHTSQGSEWEKVMIHANQAKRLLATNREFGLKWLYTAVTRAQSKVIWVSSEVRPMIS